MRSRLETQSRFLVTSSKEKLILTDCRSITQPYTVRINILIVSAAISIENVHLASKSSRHWLHRCWEKKQEFNFNILLFERSSEQVCRPSARS